MASKISIKTREKGSGTIYKDGKRFYLKIRIAGKAKTVMLRNINDTPCTKKTDASTAADLLRPLLLAKTKEEIAVYVADAKKLRKQSGLTLLKAWETYLQQPNRPDSAESTLKNHHGIFKLFLRWISNNHHEIGRISEVTTDIAEEYFFDTWKSGISAKRYNDLILSLRLIFRHLAKPAALDKNPFDCIEKKKQEVISRQEFTEAQINAIFSGFNNGFYYETTVEKLTTGRKRERIIERLQYKPMNEDEIRILLNLCCWTGCRGQDGCLMQWKNIDISIGKISYIPRKTARKTGGKVVTLPIHPNLKMALTDALHWRDYSQSGEAYVLPKIADRYRRNPSGIQKDVMKIINCATGLKTTVTNPQGRRKIAANAYSLHSFRHTFVSFCANAGVPLAVVAEIVGHGNPAMTRHYSHITTEAKANAISILPKLSSNSLPYMEVPVEVTLIDAVPNESERDQLRKLADKLPLEVIKEILALIEKQIDKNEC